MKRRAIMRKLSATAPKPIERERDSEQEDIKVLKQKHHKYN